MNLDTSRHVHAAAQRGIEGVPHSRLHEGRFGRLFRTLAPLGSQNDIAFIQTLGILAGTMVEEGEVEKEDTLRLPPSEPASNSRDTPSGFTYLAQFVDHDLTFDTVSLLDRENDPSALSNFRTPRFDLDCVYGGGPAQSPYLYEDDRTKFVLRPNASGVLDLPRGPNGRALIGDPRNDENTIVSQLHLVFLRFHNKVVDSLAASGYPVAGRFDEARRIVRWHYQWVVMNDLLLWFVEPSVLGSTLRQDAFMVSHGPGNLTSAFTWKADLKFFNWAEAPFMPLEFAVAAYRFGHSIVRATYALNDIFNEQRELPIFSDSDNQPDLGGFVPLTADRVIDWRRFFGPIEAGNSVQPGRAIDTLLATGLARLPEKVTGRTSGSAESALAFRNLRRGVALGLPSGQSVARAMGIPEDLVMRGPTLFDSPLKLQVVDVNGNRMPDPSVPRQKIEAAKPLLMQANLHMQTPLWYYVLKEAEMLSGGQRLGPVGSRLVSEVFVGLMLADPFSYFNQQPQWRPEVDPNDQSRYLYGGTVDPARKYDFNQFLSYVGAL